jgi:hypothetical protein
VSIVLRQQQEQQQLSHCHPAEAARLILLSPVDPHVSSASGASSRTVLLACLKSA